ncbi:MULTISPECIES: hypothetical protein [Roseobacteraceae]|jgi:hypothetical protein|uniref:hypothetical protein n=1 Tax=Roseobacteraceae TaxID=2854170 RepID=UPI0012FDAE12|nr:MULTISPECIES: hypothetical protein [Roseobacteraceae]
MENDLESGILRLDAPAHRLLANKTMCVLTSSPLGVGYQPIGAMLCSAAIYMAG